jgi:integrase
MGVHRVAVTLVSGETFSGAGLADDRFVFHSYRHWCASTLLAEGAPLTAVAGHLGDTVSRTYVHWLRDDRDVPADVLDRVLAAPPAVSGLASPSQRRSDSPQG